MPAPKSVVKITKEGVTFTSNVDKTQYFLYELTRAALRDVGKFVIAEFKKRYYSTFKKRKNKAMKGIKKNVWSNSKTIYPRVQIGLSGDTGFYSMFQEFGSSKQKRLGLLTKSVEENVSTIRQIEAQYLDYIHLDDSAIEEKIDEGDIEDEIE